MRNTDSPFTESQRRQIAAYDRIMTLAGDKAGPDFREAVSLYRNAVLVGVDESPKPEPAGTIHAGPFTITPPEPASGQPDGEWMRPDDWDESYDAEEVRKACKEVRAAQQRGVRVLNSEGLSFSGELIPTPSEKQAEDRVVERMRAALKDSADQQREIANIAREHGKSGSPNMDISMAFEYAADRLAQCGQPNTEKEN